MTLRPYSVRMANFHATYGAGVFCANNAQEAIQMAREQYRKSSLGRLLNDVNGFRFYVASDEPCECQEGGAS